MHFGSYRYGREFIKGVGWTAYIIALREKGAVA